MHMIAESHLTKKSKEHAISPTREEDFPEWYQQVFQGCESG